MRICLCDCLCDVQGGFVCVIVCAMCEDLVVQEFVCTIVCAIRDDLFVRLFVRCARICL